MMKKRSKGRSISNLHNPSLSPHSTTPLLFFYSTPLNVENHATTLVPRFAAVIYSNPGSTLEPGLRTSDHRNPILPLPTYTNLTFIHSQTNILLTSAPPNPSPQHQTYLLSTHLIPNHGLQPLNSPDALLTSVPNENTPQFGSPPYQPPKFTISTPYVAS